MGDRSGLSTILVCLLLFDIDILLILYDFFYIVGCTAGVLYSFKHGLLWVITINYFYLKVGGN